MDGIRVKPLRDAGNCGLASAITHADSTDRMNHRSPHKLFRFRFGKSLAGLKNCFCFPIYWHVASITAARYSRFLVGGRWMLCINYLKLLWRERSVSKSATSSPFRSAAAITGSCIRPAMKWSGGRVSRSMHSTSPRGFGNRRTQNLRLLIPRYRPAK